MKRPEYRSLRRRAAAAALHRPSFLADAAGVAGLAQVGGHSSLEQDLCHFAGRTVLISSVGQLPAALALLALDGVARRLVLCPPDLVPEHVRAVMEEAEVDAVVTDGTGPAAAAPGAARCRSRFVRPAPAVEGAVETEWILFTSGTTGRPKLVVHTLASLAGPLQQGPAGSGAVWSTFYDIRRYGGLQVLLRALLGGGSLVLSQADESVGDHLTRAGKLGVTHILGTPTHWRRALMSPTIGGIAPHYVRLSGEVADQAILDQLARTFPAAGLTHAFASTEAGVGFEVDDGLAGFPASVLERPGSPVEIKIANGSLCIRSPRTAMRYLGDHRPLADREGFVDTGDTVTRRGERYLFAGRREGVINVGGQKVHPEEVEAVINRHPAVQMARVIGRPNPITGSLVIAELVLRDAEASAFVRVRDEVLATCRAELAAHKVPAMLRQRAAIASSAAGKLDRSHA